MSARFPRACSLLILGITLWAAPRHLFAQGTIRGAVTTASGGPASGAAVRISGTSLGAVVDSSGSYRILRVPAGTYVVRVTKLGFAPDSATVVVGDGETVQRDVRLRPSAELLGNVVVTAQRLGESEA